MDGFAVGTGRDEIEEPQQCVLIGPELVEGFARPLRGFADFEVAVECFGDQGAQPFALLPLEVALDLIRDFQ